MLSSVNLSELISSILYEGYEFIENLCSQFDTTKRILPHDLLKDGWISLGKAKNTRDKDECYVKSSGILTKKNGLPYLSITFKCWQGGGQTFRWSSYDTAKRYLEERGHSTKDLHDDYPTTPLSPSVTKPVPSQSKELTLEQKKTVATRIYYRLGTTGASDYLKKKGFNDGEQFLTGIRFGENFIAIPLFASFDDYENCEPCGIQKIYDDGSKKFTKNSHSSGSFFVIGNIKNTSKIAICEGIATGLSIHLALGIPVIVAFNAGNLTPVGIKVREQFPKEKILICSDNDQWKSNEINQVTGKKNGNTGLIKGRAAADACNGKLVFPVFDGLNCSKKPTDFNDLNKLAGIDAVKMQIESPIVPANKKEQFRNSYPHNPEYLEIEKKLPKQVIEEEKKRIRNFRLPQLIRVNAPNTQYFLEDRYLKPFEFNTTEKKIIAYVGTMSTGKTTAIEQSMRKAKNKGFKTCTIAHRITLAKTLASRLGVDFYRDDEEKINPRIAKSDNLAICIDSCYRLIENTYDIVFIDEFDQVFRQLLALKKNRLDVFKQFKRLLREAQIIVVADAHLSERSLNFLKNIRPNLPIEVHASRYKVGKDRKCRIWKSENALIDKMLTMLRNEGRIVVSTDSKEKSNQLFLRFKSDFPDKKGIVINQDTKSKDEPKRFLADINYAINEYDYVIYSPSIASGISIDDLETYKHFNGHFGLFSPLSGPSPLDDWQQLLRFRAKFDVNIFINPRTENRPESIDELANTLETKTAAVCEKKYALVRAEELKSLIDSMKLPFKQIFETLDKEGIYHQEILAIVENNRMLNNLKQAFCLQALEDGWELEFIDDESTNENVKINSTLSTIAYNEMKEKAEEITPTMAEKMRSNVVILSLEEKMSLDKFDMGIFYNVKKVSTELISADERGRLRREILLLENIYEPNRALNDDGKFLVPFFQGNQDNPLKDFKGNVAKATIHKLVFDEAGLSLQEHESDGHKFIQIHSDNRLLDSSQFDSSSFKENKKLIQAVYPNKKRQSPIKFISECLYRVGLKLTCVKTVRKGNKKTYIYSVDTESFTRMNSFLEQRGINQSEKITDMTSTKDSIESFSEVISATDSNGIRYDGPDYDDFSLLEDSEVYRAIMSGELTPPDDDDRPPVDYYF